MQARDQPDKPGLRPGRKACPEGGPLVAPDGRAQFLRRGGVAHAFCVGSDHALGLALEGAEDGNRRGAGLFEPVQLPEAPAGIAAQRRLDESGQGMVDIRGAEAGNVSR